jgi:uncharacterized protein (DUF3820 family)
MKSAEDESDNFNFPDEWGLNPPPLTRAQLLSTRMEHGAFSGWRVIELPLKQIRWLAKESKSVKEPLRKAIKELLEDLEGEGFGKDSGRQLLINGPALAELWMQEMVSRHNAKGGTQAAMQWIEEAAGVLQRIVRGD